MGSCGTFVLWRLGSVTFKLFAAINLYSVSSGHMALYWSAGRTAEFENIGRNVVVASKSGPVETGPTIQVATALLYNSTALKQTTEMSSATTVWHNICQFHHNISMLLPPIHCNFQMLECVKHSFRSFQDLDFYLQALSGSKGGRLKKHFALWSRDAKVGSRDAKFGNTHEGHFLFSLAL